MGMTSEPTDINSNTAAVELGKRLRAAREQRGLSIGEVAERLKLPAKQIEALESGDYSGLPEMVFVRGFLRTYGRFLNLDDNLMADCIDRIAPTERRNSYATERKGQNAKRSGNYINQPARKSFPTWAIGLAAVLAIVGGVFAWQTKSRVENEKIAGHTANEMEVAASSAANIGTNNVKVITIASEASTVSIPALEQVASSASQPASAVQAASTPTGNQELVVKVRYRSTLAVKDKNGKTLIEQIVPANSEHRFSDGAPYNVWIGYSTGASASYNGQSIEVGKHLAGKRAASFVAGGNGQ